MIKESIYQRFQPGYIPPDNVGKDACWFIFDNSKLLVMISDNKAAVPTADDIEKLSIKTTNSLYLGKLDGTPCFAGNIKNVESVSASVKTESLRSLFGVMDDGVFLLAGRAYQLINWRASHRFCGKCGALAYDKKDERAMICKNCGTVVYPMISPAIIVAIEKGSSILLAHSTHFFNNMYSVISGFVEPGETLEDCVRREVKEEVGIEVKNIKYFSSQAWPFPNSLMIGFTAEYAGGNITIDNFEIDDAGWYNVNSLPQIPNPISISRGLIDQFIEKHKS